MTKEVKSDKAVLEEGVEGKNQATTPDDPKSGYHKLYFKDNQLKTLDSSSAETEVVKTTGAQVITDKDIDGGTASNTSRITIPSGTKATLDGLTRKAGTIVYATDLQKYFFDNGTTLVQSSGSGSGSGEINYVLNPDAEGNTVGFAVYADAAAATPVDGDGGSANVVLSRTTTAIEVIRGDASFKLAKDAADRQGEGLSYDITIDNADVNKLLKMEFEYQTTANYASGDVLVFVYDITNATLITPNSNSVPASVTSPGRHAVSWNSTDSTSYRVIWHVATTNATAYDFFVDTVVVGPGKILSTPALSGWESFTPADPSMFTSSASEGFWRRVGENIEVQVAWTLSSAVSSTVILGGSNLVPNSLTVDAAKTAVVNPTGGWTSVDSSAAATANDFAGIAAYSDTASGVIL